MPSPRIQTLLACALALAACKADLVHRAGRGRDPAAEGGGREPSRRTTTSTRCCGCRTRPNTARCAKPSTTPRPRSSTPRSPTRAATRWCPRARQRNRVAAGGGDGRGRDRARQLALPGAADRQRRIRRPAGTRGWRRRRRSRCRAWSRSRRPPPPRHHRGVPVQPRRAPAGGDHRQPARGRAAGAGRQRVPRPRHRGAGLPAARHREGLPPPPRRTSGTGC